MGGNNGPTKRARVVKPKRSGLTPAQEAAQAQMRRALEEDRYSAVGSIVDTDSDDDDPQKYRYKGLAVRIDKAAIQQAIRKHQLYERLGVLPSSNSMLADEHGPDGDGEEDGLRKPAVEDSASLSGKRHAKTKKKKKRKPEVARLALDSCKPVPKSATLSKDPLALDAGDDDVDRDGTSIFGATQGSNNSIWVQCDKCESFTNQQHRLQCV